MPELGIVPTAIILKFRVAKLKEVSPPSMDPTSSMLSVLEYSGIEGNRRAGYHPGRVAGPCPVLAGTNQHCTYENQTKRF